MTMELVLAFSFFLKLLYRGSGLAINRGILLIENKEKKVNRAKL